MDIALNFNFSIRSWEILTCLSVTAGCSVSSVTEKKRDRKASRAIDLEDLEKDYALTKARMQLAHSDVKHLVVGEYKSNAISLYS